MATFNRAHLIRESIDSILNQTRPPDEFIVVNDGSTDATADIIRSYGDRIRYIEKPNGGKSSALNRVLPGIESTYAWIFDDDDIALPNALESHLEFLAENPDCDFSYSTNYLFSGEFSANALQRGRLKAFPARCGADYFLWLMQSPFLPTLMQGMLIPTRCYRSVGWFDETLLRCEDIDMLLRLARRFRAGYVGQPTFAERLHDGARGPAFERHADADRYRIFRRYKRPIFEKLRGSLSLDEYLPSPRVPATSHRDLEPSDTRQALLQRALVMATHGLFPEAVADFRAYAEQLDAKAPLDEAARKRISALTHVRGPDAVPPTAYFRQLGATSRGHPPLFAAALRGLYWSILRELRKRRPGDAWRLLALGASATLAYLGIPMQREDILHEHP